MSVSYLDGKKYSSLKKLCEDKNIPYLEFLKKRTDGWDDIEIYNYYLTDNHRGFYVNGRLYASLASACADYRLPYRLIYSRISGVLTGPKFLRAAAQPIPSSFFDMVTLNELGSLEFSRQKRFKVCDENGLYFTSKEALKFFSSLSETRTVVLDIGMGQCEDSDTEIVVSDGY